MFSDAKLYYTEHEPDRQSHIRKDPASVLESFSNGNARLIPYWNGLHWLSNTTIKQPDLLSINKSALNHDDLEKIFLGRFNTVNFFGVDLSHLSEERVYQLLPDGKFVDMRMTPLLKRAEQAPLLVYLRGLYLWHKKNIYCGVCSQQTESIDAGHARRCSSCSNVLYPRVDPAVIVLIEHIPEIGEPLCLLARHRSRHEKMYSTLAGFVETGETLEAAVKREMMEEVGLEVHNIRYIASQPWPFPSSIMMGFYAQTDSTEISLDQDEVHDAKWFSANEIKQQVASDQLILSREDSIARYLIQQWVNNQQKMN